MGRWRSWLAVALLVAGLLAGERPSRAGEEIPEPPDERAVVLRLLDAMAVGDEPFASPAKEGLKPHAKLAGPLLRERLEEPKLPNWTLALDALADLAPDELEKLAAGLGKDKPDLTIRYHLWKLAGPRERYGRGPWADWQPFAENRIKESASLAAIAGFGEGAVPELVRSLGDKRLQLPAAYAIGALKLARAAPDLTRVIPETRVYAGGGRTGPPPRNFSLAAAALARLGAEGQALLLDRLARTRITVEPNTLAPEPRATADLIAEALGHVAAKAELGKVLTRLLDGDDQAVRLWALKSMIETFRGDPFGPKQALPAPMEKVIALMSENEKGTDRPSELAWTAARYLVAQGSERAACEGCVTQFEKGRFLRLIEEWAGREDSAWWSPIGFEGGFDFPDAFPRLKRLALALVQKSLKGVRYWDIQDVTAVRLFGRLTTSWDPARRDPGDLAVLRGVLRTSEGMAARAEAAGFVGRLADLGGAAEASDILTEAIEKEVGRPEVQKKDPDAGKALSAMVRAVPRTLGKDPLPVLEKVALAPIHEWPRREAIAQLAIFGDLRSAESLARAPLSGYDGATASLFFGFHLLPKAVELVNGDDPLIARAALRMIAVLAAYREEHPAFRRAWRRVEPDSESAAIARLAARHVGPGVLRQVASITRESYVYGFYESVKILKPPEALPGLLWKAAFKIPYAGEAVAAYELEPKDYDVLLVQAKTGNIEALKALSGTANPKAAELWETWNKPGDHRIWLARSLLRIGDERGVDLCLQIATGERVYIADRDRAVRSIGLCKTAKAAERLVEYIASRRYGSGEAYAALADIGKPAVPAILRALADPAWAPVQWTNDVDRLRAQLAETLGKTGDARAVPILKWLGAARPGHYHESYAAFAALCEIGTPDAHGAVLELVRQGARLDWPRWSHLAPLIEKAPGAGDLFVEIAERCLEQKQSDNFGYAVTLAARLTRHPDATRDRLYKLYTDPKAGSVRAHLKSALQQLGDKRVEPPAPTPPKPVDPAQVALLGKRLDSPDINQRHSTALALAQMKAPGILQELFARLNRSLNEHTVRESLSAHHSDEAADLLADLITNPNRRPGLTRDAYWSTLRALKQNGSPRALAAYTAFLYEDLASADIPRSRTALEWLAEADKEGLRAKLAELASSPEPHLRCLALYGALKHFSYRGPYDPFESGPPLDRMATELKAQLAAAKPPAP